MSLAIALFGLASFIHLHAASLVGDPAGYRADREHYALVLNGLGLRTRHRVKV